jgi:PAS domain-containing protein
VAPFLRRVYTRFGGGVPIIGIMSSRLPGEGSLLATPASAIGDTTRELYLSLLENSTDFIAIVGLTGDILYVNEAGRP